MTSPNRRNLLAAQSLVTGLDFVFVAADQVTLEVHFLRSPATLDSPMLGSLGSEQVRIRPTEPGDPIVNVDGISWTGPAGDEQVLRITVANPGGFSDYVLRIDDARIDPYFNEVRFNFKANCPVELDCEPDCPDCPPDDPVDFPVDYTARDFWSYRRALLDFAAQRYPGWHERVEADLGVMFAETMSALADEFSYYQDRISQEAYLETATQRRSLRGHARLVDYWVHDGRGASGWLVVEASGAGAIPAGTPVWALSAENQRIDFSIGTGLQDAGSYDVAPALNALRPHVWDESIVCLDAGATQLDLSGALLSDLVFNDPPDDPSGRWVVLQTNPEDPGVPSRTQMVRATRVTEHVDSLLEQPVTRLQWEAGQAVAHQMELASLSVHANVMPVSAGRTLVQRFTIGASEDDSDRPAALERQGRLIEAAVTCDCGADPCTEHAVRSVSYQFSLPATIDEGLVWLGDPIESAEPELLVSEVVFTGSGWDDVALWQFRRSFLSSGGSSLPQSRDFVLEDGTWKRTVGYRRGGSEIVHVDYASSEGVTVRFGDGEFGRVPTVGAIFQVTYRVGNGPIGNLPAETVAHLDPSVGFVNSVRNPQPTSGGEAPEPAGEVRMLAPERFRAEPLRAVRPEDYASAVERLEWTEHAGAAFRWTGSWLTAFVTPDPQGSQSLTAAQVASATRQLDRFRQAGREAHVAQPRYADIDLDVVVCATPVCFPGEVYERVMDALFGASAFFSPDRFTFGTPLDRPSLEAHIQSVEGVLAVRSIDIRRRGRFDWRSFEELLYQVGDNEIVRIENDPDRPTRGTLALRVEGGA